MAAARFATACVAVLTGAAAFGLRINDRLRGAGVVSSGLTVAYRVGTGFSPR